MHNRLAFLCGWENAAGEFILHHPPCGRLVPLLLRKEASAGAGRGLAVLHGSRTLNK